MKSEIQAILSKLPDLGKMDLPRNSENRAVMENRFGTALREVILQNRLSRIPHGSELNSEKKFLRKTSKVSPLQTSDMEKLTKRIEILKQEIRPLIKKLMLHDAAEEPVLTLNEEADASVLSSQLKCKLEELAELIGLNNLVQGIFSLEMGAVILADDPNQKQLSSIHQIFKEVFKELEHVSEKPANIELLIKNALNTAASKQDTLALVDHQIKLQELKEIPDGLEKNQESASETESTKLKPTPIKGVEGTIAETILKNIQAVPNSTAAKLHILQPSSLMAPHTPSMVGQSGTFIEHTVIEQIAGRFHIALSEQHSELRMVLKPEHLGQVRLSLDVEGKTIFARIQVENETVKHIVENNAGQLKDALEEKGIKIQGFEVSISKGDRKEAAFEQDERRFQEFQGRLITERIQWRTEPEAAVLGYDTGRRYGFNTVEMYA